MYVSLRGSNRKGNVTTSLYYAYTVYISSKEATLLLVLWYSFGTVAIVFAIEAISNKFATRDGILFTGLEAICKTGFDTTNTREGN